MPGMYEVRANYQERTIVMYQAYNAKIADIALKSQRFETPFSFHRMTWLKPSFLWLMHRSQWGQKSNQQRILAVHITRVGWERALALGILTHPEPSVFPVASEWAAAFQNAPVHIQWDTERSIRGAGLNHFSIQVGISRHLIREYVDQWIVKIEDLTATVAKIRGFLKSGNVKDVKRLLPPERVYPIATEIGKRILID